MEKVSLNSAFDLVVIGGSAGSLSVIIRVVETLRSLPFPVLIVVHRGGDSDVAEMLAARASVRLKELDEKEHLAGGTVYVAPADYHVLIEKDGTISLDMSEKVNFSRPSIDVTFESAAEVYGSRLAGILLSGANNDGVEGLKCIWRRGGRCVVQDPATAEVRFMPQAALMEVPGCDIVAGAGLGEYLNKL